MKLIIGLGNPGARYENTRHNLGAHTVQRIAKKYNKRLRLHRSLKTRLATLHIGRHECMLAVPYAFMNVSGESAALVLKAKNVEPKDILMVHDDMDLELGMMRLRRSGGAGGHKGVASVIQSLRTDQLNRLKLGIGRAPFQGSASDYVLSAFSKKEQRIIDAVVQKAMQVCGVWVQNGTEKAMQQLGSDI